MSITKGWEFSKSMGYTGSADKDKTPVRAHERTVQAYAKGGAVKHEKPTTPPARPQKHFDRMENFRKERDAEPDSPAAETSGMKRGGKFIKGMHLKKGALHKEMGIPKGEKIPAKKLAAAAKKPGKEGRRARVAETMRKFAEGGMVSKNLSPDSTLGIPGGDGTKNVVGFKKGGKAKGGGSAAKKAAGALAQIAAMAQMQAKPGGAQPIMGAPPGGMPPPPSLGAGPPPGGPMGMKRGGKTKKK